MPGHHGPQRSLIPSCRRSAGEHGGCANGHWSACRPIRRRARYARGSVTRTFPSAAVLALADPAHLAMPASRKKAIKRSRLRWPRIRLSSVREGDWDDIEASLLALHGLGHGRSLRSGCGLGSRCLRPRTLGFQKAMGCWAKAATPDP